MATPVLPKFMLIVLVAGNLPRLLKRTSCSTTWRAAWTRLISIRSTSRWC